MNQISRKSSNQPQNSWTGGRWVVIPACLSVLMISGCASTIQSSLYNPNELEEAGGVNYALPIQLTEVRLIVKAAEEEKLKKTLSDLQKKAKAADTAKNEAATNRAKISNLLLNLPKLPGSDDAKSELEKRFAEASAQEKALLLAKSKADTKVVDALSKLKRAQASTDGCIYSLSLKLLPPVGDPNFRFVAKDFHLWTRDDETSLKVNANGLLETIESKSEDKTPGILVEMQEPQDNNGALALTPKSGSGEKGCGERQPFTEIVDLAGDLSELNTSLWQVANLKFTSVGLESIGSNPSPLDNQPNILTPENSSELIESHIQKSGGGGLYYRTPAPRVVSVQHCKKAFSEQVDPTSSPPSNRCQSIEAWQVSLPQAGRIGFIPMKSAAFVSTINNVQLENGVLHSVERNRPSEIEEALRLPLKAVKEATGAVIDPFLTPLTEWIPTPSAELDSASE